MILPNVGGMRDNTAMYPQATVNTALHLSAIGVFDRENAQICGVSVAAIRNWRSGRRRAPRRDDRRAQCPRCHGRAVDEPAYAYLLGLYLGDGHLYDNGRSVALVDSQGRRYSGDPQPLDSMLIPGQEYHTDFVFDLPDDAAPARFLLASGDWPTHLMIAHENAFLHGRITWRLQA